MDYIITATTRRGFPHCEEGFGKANLGYLLQREKSRDFFLFNLLLLQILTVPSCQLRIDYFIKDE